MAKIPLQPGEGHRLEGRNPAKKSFLSRPAKSLRALIGAAALFAAGLGAEQKSKADPAEFGPEINDICAGRNEVGGAQLMAGFLPNKFKMTFSSLPPSCRLNSDIYSSNFEILDDGGRGVIIRGIGLVSTVPGMDSASRHEETYLEITNRGDGEDVTTVSIPQGGEVEVDGVNRWNQRDPRCTGGGVEGIHPSAINPGQLKITAGFSARPTYEAWLGFNITDPDLCVAESERIAAAGSDLFAAGLLRRKESTFRHENTAPETDKLIAVGREHVLTRAWDAVLLSRDPATGELFNMRRTATGTWVREDPETPGGGSDPIAVPFAMLKRQTPAGREVHLLVSGDARPVTEDGFLKVLALEEMRDGSFQEVPITMEAPLPGPADEDSDGIPDARTADGRGPDNCRWRFNPEQVDSNANGHGDACEADCPSYPPQTPDPGTLTPDGLIRCEAPSLAPTVRTDINGSTFYTTASEVNLNGRGETTPQAGERGGYIHSDVPRMPGIPRTPSRPIVFPAGNSLRLRMREGTGRLTHRAYDDPFAASVTVTIAPSAGWINFPVVAPGAVLGLEGSHAEWEIGSEERPVTCPPFCPDGGTDGGDGGPRDDGGRDAGDDLVRDDGGLDTRDDSADAMDRFDGGTDEGTDTFDAGDGTDRGDGLTTDGGTDNLPDESTDTLPDNQTDRETQTDGGIDLGTDLETDTERADTSTERPPERGCACTVADVQKPVRSKLAMVLLAGSALLARRRRKEK